MIKIFLLSVALCSVFVIPVLAEEQVPGSVLMVQSDPYYFSEGDFGLKILKFFELPVTPYLVPGKTTDQSTFNEISDAYREHAKDTEQQIVSDDNRATMFVVEFSNGDLKEPYRIDTFQKFTHIDKNVPNAPYYYQTIRYGLELESLPSQDKRFFYDDLVIPSVNSGKKPEPFDVTVSVMTGDGNIIQKWQYPECAIIAYTPYLDENLAKLKFVGDFVSEIRDKIAFSCDGFNQDFAKQEPLKKPESIITPHIPDRNTRADHIIVQFSGGELTSINTFYSFSKFLPLVKDPNSGLPISIPGNVIGQKPMFSLESLPTKDKEKFYAFVGRYINPGATPQPFDTTIHLVTAHGEILQSWQYADCSANNYVAFFTDNMILYKFKQSLGSEIREKTFFDCAGLTLNSNQKQNVDTNQTFTPNDSDRAQTFVVHFQGPDISPEKTVTSFTKFSPISNEELQFLLPNSPFGKEPKFYLESLPNKDNQWYYDLMSKYINAGKVPAPFDVTLDVLTGDGTQIQGWKYTDCQVLEYKTYLEDSLFLRKFTNKFEKEFRDRTVFQCVGFSFDGNSKPPQKISEKLLNYADFIPSDQSRITKLLATFSNGDLSTPFTIGTIGKFTPAIEQRHQTQAQFIELSVAIIPNETPNSNPQSYDEPPTCAPEQNPPGCTPCPPNNPHCSDGGDNGGGEEIPPTPEEPGITTPQFTVLVTMPHLSITQKNDYIKSTEFTIKSIPSKDKLPYYDIINKYINAGKKPEPIDVTFDYLSGDNTIVQSWKYSECELTDFKIKRDDVLLYFSLSGTPGAADIVDTSTFQCTGFAVDFNQKESNLQLDATMPSQYDRAMLNLAHWYGGELQTQKSSALLQEFNTLDDSDIVFGGLPNIHHKDSYEFVSRYVNPGKTPEPIDMRFDTVTGDGTVLYSMLYSDCSINDASVFLSDNMAVIRYVSGLKSEIRGQAVADCIGTNIKVSPQSDPSFDHSGNLRKITVNTQRAIGISPDEVSCDAEYTLMIRSPNNVPICAKNDSVKKLEERGWKQPNIKEKKNLIDVLRPLLPTSDERAISFVVDFEGTDISPPKTISTFSKFFPVKDADSIIQRPGNSLDSSSKSFYLESLPNNDNSWYYEIASKYVNAGAKPEPFNVTVHIMNGSEDTLQTWKYRECEISGYSSYYDENLLTYKFHGMWQSEIKDKTLFECAGLLIDS